MTSSLPDTPEGATTQTVADALREVADWLEAHPEVKPAHAFLRVDAASREDLETLAAALGDRATERLGYGNDRVEIRGRFGDDEWRNVAVWAEVKVEKLMDEPQPPRPKYRPILPPRDEEGGAS